MKHDLHKLLSTKDMAELLGITPNVLTAKRKKGVIPHYNVCGCFRYHPQEVLDSLRVAESNDSPKEDPKEPVFNCEACGAALIAHICPSVGPTGFGCPSCKHTTFFTREEILRRFQPGPKP